jgi:hypothetical protein
MYRLASTARRAQALIRPHLRSVGQHVQPDLDSQRRQDTGTTRSDQACIQDGGKPVTWASCSQLPADQLMSTQKRSSHVLVWPQAWVKECPMRTIQRCFQGPWQTKAAHLQLDPRSTAAPTRTRQQPVLTAHRSQPSMSELIHEPWATKGTPGAVNNRQPVDQA